MSFLAGSEKAANRITTAVTWTEQYKDRMQQLLGNTVTDRNRKAASAVRALLLQHCYEGRDALALPMGRNNVDFGFMVQVLGNNLNNTPNKFQLELFGVDADGSETSIGQSTAIKQFGTVSEFVTALEPTGLTVNNTSVLVGNPYYSPDLLVYGGVQAATGGFSQYSLPGVWFVQIDPTFYEEMDFKSISLKPYAGSEVDMPFTTAIAVEKTFDLLDTATTLVTDVHRRTQEFSWQAGTTVMCLDFIDIGYGIISATSRNFNIEAPGAL